MMTMLSDELKKSLEPIQTSDELLEKTRKAIEEARLQQARETVAQKSHVRSSIFDRLSFNTVIYIICAVLLVGGIAVTLPFIVKMGKPSRTKSEKGIQAHNDAIVDVVSEIDADLGFEGERVYESQCEDTTEWESAETTTADAKEEETEADTAPQSEDNKGKSNFLGPDSHYSSVNYIRVGDYILHISEDRKGLLLLSMETGEDLPNTPEHNVPVLKGLGEEEHIIGLSYDEKVGLLYITTEENSNLHIYSCRYEDGRVVGNDIMMDV